MAKYIFTIVIILVVGIGVHIVDVIIANEAIHEMEHYYKDRIAVLIRALSKMEDLIPEDVMKDYTKMLLKLFEHNEEEDE